VTGQRVCILTSVHPAGDTRIYEKQTLTLSEAGYEVVLIAPAPHDGRPPDSKRQSAIYNLQSEIALRLLRLPVHRLARMTIGSLRVLSAALRERAAVYHFHDPELLPVGLVLKLLGARVLYDVHEDYPEQILSKHYLPGVLRAGIAWLFGALEKAVAGSLDGVVAATDAIAGNFRHARTVTVRNYPKLGNLQSPVVPVPGRPFRLVHLAGTLTEERGITNLVRAMERLGDEYELVLAGKFVPDGYQASVSALPGYRRTRHLGLVPHARVWEVYGACDAGVVTLLPLPRYRVSLPVKMFEFMAAGLPVVASDFPLFGEIVEQNRCGICVDPTRPEAIAAAVRRLSADRDAAIEMGRRGRAAILERYNWDNEARGLLALYRAVTGHAVGACRHSLERSLGV
jgi:glycosyltransferase involved in cell wall biosynthesis